jgi:hypothetical protein
MKTYSGSTSEGFLPAALPAAGAAATAVAPAPQDPSATFADALEQQTPKAPAFGAWPTTAPSAGAAGSTPNLPGAVSVTAATVADATLSSDEPLPRYAWLGQPAAPTPSSVTNGSVSASSNDPTSLPMLASSLLFSTAAASNPSPSNTTPTTPAAAGFSVGDEDAALTDDSPSDQPGTTAARLPPTPSPRAFTTYAASTWFGQRTASSSAPARAASSASATAPSPAATADSSTEPDVDFTGAAIVASVFGRASAPKPAGPLLAEAQTASLQSAATPAAASSAFSAPLAGSPLATIMAHAAILAATSKNNSANSAAAATATSSTTLASSAPAIFGTSSFTVSGKPSTAPSSLEKKSSASSSERSFLQESPVGTTATDTTASLLQDALAASLNLAGNQTVTTSSASSSSLSERSSLASISTAGMANGKKVEDMNSSPEMTSLIVSSGTHPLVTSTTADVHIALDSNHNFTDALDQVMHIAELGNMSRSTPPLRVAIEIQTPPGAIVNVYVSRQSDSSYRAQLSTNDPQALAWVQDQIGSLKNTSDSGSAIRWSPAQLEPGTASLSTSSNSANSERGYDWNRGGQQGQSGYQQDERNNRRRSTYMTDEPETAFETFSTVGGVA